MYVVYLCSIIWIFLPYSSLKFSVSSSFIVISACSSLLISFLKSNLVLELRRGVMLSS